MYLIVYRLLLATNGVPYLYGFSFVYMKQRYKHFPIHKKNAQI